MKWHRWVGQIGGQPSVGFHQDILHDIAGVHALLHAAVHPLCDHPLDGVAVSSQQAIDGSAIALPNAIQQHHRGLLFGRKIFRWYAGWAGCTGHENREAFTRYGREMLVVAPIQGSRSEIHLTNVSSTLRKTV